MMFLESYYTFNASIVFKPDILNEDVEKLNDFTIFNFSFIYSRAANERTVFAMDKVKHQAMSTILCLQTMFSREI